MDKNLLLSDALSNCSSSKREMLINAIIEFVEIKKDERLSSQLVNIFNNLHVSACIVDDMLDNEILHRTKKHAFFSRHGSAKAAITAMHLFNHALLEMTKLGYNVSMGNILELVECLIHSEEADVGIVDFELSLSPIEWYDRVSSMKSSYELFVFIEILKEKSLVIKKDQERIYNAIRTFGQLIQITNDWEDLFENDPLYRTGASDEYMVTYSLPLALYCQHFDSQARKLVGMKIKRENIGRIFERILCNKIKELSRQYICDKYAEFMSFIPPESQCASSLQQIALFALSGLYWKGHMLDAEPLIKKEMLTLRV